MSRKPAKKPRRSPSTRRKGSKNTPSRVSRNLKEIWRSCSEVKKALSDLEYELDWETKDIMENKYHTAGFMLADFNEVYQKMFTGWGAEDPAGTGGGS